jgi:hemerythrin
MTRIHWDEALTTGEHDIDSEHRLLFFIADNLLDESLGSRLGLDPGLCLRTLDKYIRTHFENEERYMRENRYELADAHTLEHVDFALKFLETQKKHRAGTLVLPELKAMVTDWLFGHILGADKRMIAAVRAGREAAGAGGQEEVRPRPAS